MQLEINPQDTPSAQIIKAANKTATAKDSLGREIGVRKLSTLDRLRLFRLAGPELAANEPWLEIAFLAYAVSSIDGDPVTRPNNLRELEFVIERLDDWGLAAAAEGYVKIVGDTDRDASVANAKN